jgi:hypothetical protein
MEWMKVGIFANVLQVSGAEAILAKL